MKIINTSQFDEEIKEGKVLVDCFAEWCGPCKMLAPFLEQLEQIYGDKIKIVKVNIDNDAEIANRFNIMSIPCLLLFKDGKLVKSEVGFKNLQMLEVFVNSVD